MVNAILEFAVLSSDSENAAREGNYLHPVTNQTSSRLEQFAQFIQDVSASGVNDSIQFN
jgi:hypothetical protein